MNRIWIRRSSSSKAFVLFSQSIDSSNGYSGEGVYEAGCWQGSWQYDSGELYPHWLCVVVMIIPALFIVLGLGHILIRIRPIRHTWLVKVMICRVGNIRVERGQGEIWITICIWIIVIIIHIIKMLKTKNQKQANKQIKMKKNLA